MKKRKTKRSLSSGYLLLLLTGICISAILLSFTLNISGGPLNAVAGYVFIPMQNGMESLNAGVSAAILMYTLKN